MPLNWVNGRWVAAHKPTPAPIRVQRLLGACLFVRREVFQNVGLFDESFFLFSEEDDFCYRVFRQGRDLYYFPQTQIIHLGGQSAARNNPQAVVYANESKVRFFRKHYGAVTQLFFRIIWLFALVIRIPSVLSLAPAERRGMINAYLRSMAALFQPLTAQAEQAGTK
jgi:GT2 family glycosyltransferase